MAPGEIIQLSQIPFLDPAELTSGRFLASLTFHDKDWRMWVETQEKGFVEIHGWPAEASYFARTPEKPTDFTTRFLNFMAHNANFIEVMKLFSAIQDDIFNLSAALAKLEIVFQSKDFEQTGGNRMASTEIEYILLICRSIFDLLQETLARIWSKIELTDKTLRKKQLKKSFADMTLRGNAVRTAQDIASQFQLPMCLADCYARQAPVFLKIREYRDNLVHGGQNVQTIFRGQSGFMIAKRLGPFVNQNIWRDNEVINNDLVPLGPALALIIHDTLAACEEFSQVLLTNFKFLNPIVPGMALYMRGYFNNTLQAALSDADSRIQEGRVLLPQD